MSCHLFTIGYATKPLDTFIAQLQAADVTAVADVRSVPYSKVFQCYHREPLQACLEKAGIRYVYLGEELGPRSKDPDHYNSDGQVQFDRLMKSAPFLLGVDRLQSGVKKGFKIALMCAEKDPITCHRSLLVSHYLSQLGGWQVEHILHDGTTETQSQLEQRLKQLHGCETDLFADDQEQLMRAYRLQWRLTSYIRTEK